MRFVKKELHSLLEQFDPYQNQMKDLDQELEDLIQGVPGAQEMIDIKGIGVTTVATFCEEVGYIKEYSHPQQLVNLAGLSLREHSSGKYKGQTRINKRGRRRLRKALYLAIRPLVRHNPTFQALHRY